MAATVLPIVAALAAFLVPLSQAKDGQDTPPAAGVPPPSADVPGPVTAAPVYGPPDETAPTIAVGERPAAISPALFTAVERAMADYPAIASSRVSVRASRADLRAAKNQGLPSLALQGVALGTGKGDLGTTVVADQPIFTWGRISSGVDAAKARRRASIAKVDESAMQVALDLTDAYFDLARARRRSVILGKGVDEQDMLVESIQRRVEQKVSPRSDLELARSRAAQVRQQLATTKAERQSALMRVFQFVGDTSFNPGNVPIYDAAVSHPDPAGAFDQALACSPKRKRLLAEADAARAQAKVAKASALPQLSAQMSYNQIIGTRAGLAVTAQTGGGLSAFAAADAARLRADSATIDVTTADRELIEQLNGDLIENASARDQIESSLAASQSAAVVTESFKRQFITGRRTWLDVMNAVREANQAELAEADAEISAMASAARILLRTCRWEPQGDTGGMGQ
ncbi:adhesin transport system outer membrane protein [Hephaestia caeni]|uniref:Adhesin transport system outer membrane protein n=1 Tax=Hephaestia caeni TaxID=645617 RepID=A0A397P8Q1_9SPHN|nr:TolC family protein [Hephaestia caeni]RIA43547.1 adhesin transport system outer membrane protein [Hephaestia caeni]